MGKIILIVALALAPLALWVAGCRDNGRTAGFPRGPEVGRLARSSGRSEREIPRVSDPIDSEVSYAPDPQTFARIQAVVDREARLSSRDARPGLFVLPREDFPELAAGSPNPDGRLFQSSPAIPRPGSSDWSGSVPSDLSAMAPPRFIPGPGLPPAAMASPEFPEPELQLLDIPGVFLGIESQSSRSEPLSLAPIRPGGEGMAKSGPEFSPPLAGAVPDSTALASFSGRDPIPIPLAPAPKISGLTAAEPPGEGGRRLEELFREEDLRLALTPLPDLSAYDPLLLSGGDSISSFDGISVPPPEAMPDPEAMISAINAAEAARAQSLPRFGRFEPAGDPFRLNFWDDYPVAEASPANFAAVNPPAPELPPLPSGIEPDDFGRPDDMAESLPTALELLLSLESESASRVNGEGGIQSAKAAGPSRSEAGGSEAWRKITLLPAQLPAGKKGKDRKRLENIDSQVEAPPLIF
ncbi:MAG: hypothetical protein LBU64_00260 [Planctomycetota bacterium]|nr:hypothetical protein [Planctomycetota bacterium]